jgi:lipopolysaccharide/colanic/teichoic acid biosynthesis glycosyltransferase
MSFYRRVGKRVFDLALALPLLILTAPIMAVVGVLVRFKLGSPVLFRQRRPGLNEEPFEILKFRTMTDEVNDQGELLPDRRRLTRFGQLLRTTSLDELPEMLNVVKGEMSLVGPRPLLMQYLPLYSADQRRRHEVRPGLTGWAQVNGRNAAPWEDKFAMDVSYIENVSIGWDIKILWQTITTVLRRADIAWEGHATAPNFTGSENQ